VKHDVRIEDIHNNKLPEALADPVMVFESKTNSLVVLTEFQDESGRSVVVACPWRPALATGLTSTGPSRAALRRGLR